MLPYYMLFIDSDVLAQLLYYNITRHAAIAAIVLPAHCSWCSNDIPVDERNVLVVDDAFKNKYTAIMGITPRIFEDTLRILQKIGIVRKTKLRGRYYINPYWAATGDDNAIAQFRRYCDDNKLFPVWGDVSDNTMASQQRHIRCSTRLQTVAKYKAFCGRDNVILGATDVLLLITLANRSNMVRCPKSGHKYNHITLTGSDQRKIGDRLGIKAKTVRDSLLKMTQLHLLHKIPKENGQYMINPYVMARGNTSNITVLQQVAADIDNGLFGGFVEGEQKPVYIDGTLEFINIRTGQVI